jgi:hypothetical protein
MRRLNDAYREGRFCIGLYADMRKKVFLKVTCLVVPRVM